MLSKTSIIPVQRINEQEYIFNEQEFEGDSFQAAFFVAKYRRVTSLESLRDQLRGYGSGLKDQLYDTINRDYKDFIDIATKVISELISVDIEFITYLDMYLISWME